MPAAADAAQPEPHPVARQPRRGSRPPADPSRHPAPQARPTPLQRRWGLLTVAVAAEFVTLVLPRARATGTEDLTNAHQASPTYTGLDFTLPAALELVLLALVLLTGFAIRLRPDLTADLRPAAYALAAALPVWVTLTSLIPGLGADDAPAPADTLPAGYVAIATALATGALLVALARAPGAGARPSTSTNPQTPTPSSTG